MDRIGKPHGKLCRDGGTLMKYFLLMLLWLGVIPTVSADVAVIYRKSDRVVTSWVKPATLQIQIDTEIQNAIQSPSLGGIAADYDVVTVSDAVWGQNRGLEPLVNPGGQVVFREYPSVTARRTAQQAAEARIRANLGLTPQQFQDLKDALRTP